MGPDGAKAAAQVLVEAGACALVSWGSAGGLREEIPTGTLLVPTHVVTEQGEEYTVDAPWRMRLEQALAAPCVSGLLCSSAQPLTSVAAKQQLQRHTGAQAVDMESAAIAAVAQANALPFLVVRAVADTAGMAVPHAALQALSTDGKLQPFSVMTSLLKKPAQISTLLELARCFRMAQTSLRAVVASAGPRLGAA